jgi:hypothetical protein
MRFSLPGTRIMVLAALLLAAGCKTDPRSAEEPKRVPVRVAAATPNHHVLERIARQPAARSPFAWSTLQSRARQESLARKDSSTLSPQASR